MAAGSAVGAWFTDGPARIVLTILSVLLLGLALWASMFLFIVLVMLLFDRSHRGAEGGHRPS